MSNLKKHASRAGALALTAALFLGIAGCGGGTSKPSESPKSSAPPAQAETQKPAEAQKPAETGAPLSVSGTINVASKPSPSATYTVAAAVAKITPTAAVWSPTWSPTPASLFSPTSTTTRTSRWASPT